jgi:hypothetical protein
MLDQVVSVDFCFSDWVWFLLPEARHLAAGQTTHAWHLALHIAALSLCRLMQSLSTQGGSFWPTHQVRLCDVMYIWQALLPHSTLPGLCLMLHRQLELPTLSGSSHEADDAERAVASGRAQ